MNKASRLYPFGFLFSDDKVESIPDYYINISILDKFNYYYDALMRPHVFKKDDKFILIHGHFAHVGIKKQFSEKELLHYLLDNYESDYPEFLDTLDYIGGRFIIIIGNTDEVFIFPDATAARTAYYTLDKNIIASHLCMITDNNIYEKDETGKNAQEVTYVFDRTTHSQIKSVIPNFSLDFFKKEVNRFFPRKSNQYIGMQDSKKFELVEHLWKNQIKQYSEKYENLILSITGGNDSRVSLAMAKEYTKDIEFFTYSTQRGEVENLGKYAKALSIDQSIVRQILQDIPLNHKFLYFDETKTNLTTEEQNALSKNTLKPHGRFLISHYNNAFPNKKVMHIRGNLLEIGRAYFINEKRKNSIEEVESTFKHGLKKYKGIISDQKIHEIFSKGINTFQYHKELYGYHILDMYYWENRMGRWHSEVLNETDAAFDTFLPFNMRTIIDISLSFSLKERKSDYLFKELINRNYPILNFYGKNTKLNLYEQFKNTNETKEFSSQKSTNFFKEFIAYDIVTGEYIKETTTENKIFIPERKIVKGSFSEVKFTFNKEAGVARIGLLSKYVSASGANYLQYELYKNDSLLLTEDLSKWTVQNDINVMNMQQGDIIAVRVRALKTARAKSWQNASTVRINLYNESFTKKLSNSEITYTSPYSIKTEQID